MAFVQTEAETNGMLFGVQTWKVLTDSWGAWPQEGELDGSPVASCVCAEEIGEAVGLRSEFGVRQTIPSFPPETEAFNIQLFLRVGQENPAVWPHKVMCKEKGSQDYPI